MKESFSVKEKWENATLADNFIFYKVMRHHPDVCRRILEMLLQIKIEWVRISGEETIDVDFSSKGIRLDVYAKDEKRIFDVEMQVLNTNDLPERARYYQSAIDMDNLEPGEPYKNLKETHIIFLCMEDIYERGMPVYTFENICLENTDIKMNDRSWKHFFAMKNCVKMLKDKELKAFFRLVLENHTDSAFTTEIMDYVEEAKKNVQWRHQYMVWSNSIIAYKELAREEGLAEGRAEGRAQGLEEGRMQSKLEDAVIAVQLGLDAEVVARRFEVPLENLKKALSEVN